ncbi:unnamed protein product [Didymodactylos carnosus]|uniref:HTTM-like domain-containing protein n=1 Tax=Didymodactylos carnosus TaxID=1234261 RepID=A0A813RY55_9BILA|nr:unnamed protein product [Didymodactylos carnosus]CAF1224236.1 unnamed protein product [Didymodactylos carnosus]CAF3573505.1 unnamed protein product [Didymodactylos carnosus]CAF4032421.1 unnamed protein product [Didymodactylos carnosus]
MSVNHPRTKKTDVKKVSMNTMRQLFGFDFTDFQSWNSFLKLMNRPEDPSSLAVLRILFGILMVLDIPQERGMSHADIYYPNEDIECQFPLFNFLKPLRSEYMVLIYLTMFIGAVGITLGLFYRLSTILFTISYWYIFLLDKTSWNNHSYLYGLIGFQLILFDAHRFWSLDGLFKKKIRDSHVPLWNYTLIRFQIFVVYFIAGLKKTDLDWVTGYSMDTLGKHWIFLPFRSFMTIEQITLILVHICGLILDLFIGFILFFDRSRPIGILFCSSFHLMNSQLFSIGMFPYTMLATIPIFFHNDWPRKFIRNKFPKFISLLFVKNDTPQYSEACLYSKDDIKVEDQTNTRLKPSIITRSMKYAHTKATFRHKFFTIISILYLMEQSFLPYSHFITKVSLQNKNDKQKLHYLNPNKWSTAKRWSSHADMIVQYAQCIGKKLNEHGYDNVELKFDIWRSMNGRFNQRQIDPRIDLLNEAKWSAFSDTSWLKPLLTNLSDWRTRMQQIEHDLSNKSQNVLVTFVADFPDLHLENFIPYDLNTTIEVLEGKVIVEYLKEKKNVTLNVGEKASVPNGDYHNVYTISPNPSCYMYVYINQSDVEMFTLWDKYHNISDKLLNDTIDKNRLHYPEMEEVDLVRLTYENMSKQIHNKSFDELLNLSKDQLLINNKTNWATISSTFEKNMNKSISKRLQYKLNWKEKTHKRFKIFVNKKSTQFKRCYHMVLFALRSVFLQENFFQLVQDKFYNDGDSMDHHEIEMATLKRTKQRDTKKARGDKSNRRDSTKSSSKKKKN